MSIGAKIKYFRQQSNMCQQDLCCNILNRTILSKIENDKMLPSLPQLFHISHCLGITVSYLLDENTSPIQSDNLNLIYSNDSISTLYTSKNYYKLVCNFEDKKYQHIDNDNLSFFVGISYYNLELYKLSLKFLRKYINMFIKSDNIFKSTYINEFANSLNTLSKIMLKNKNYTKALHYLSLALEYLEQLNKTDSQIYFIIINNIGSIHCMSNNYKKVINLLESFLSNNRLLIYTKLIADMHLSLNIAYYNLSDYTNSIKHIKNAIFFYFYIGQDLDAVECYLNYINAFRYDGKTEDALNLIKAYKSLYFNEKYSSLHDKFLMQEMIIYFNIEQYEKVLDLSDKIKVTNLNLVGKANYFFILGHINFLRNNYTQAYRQLMKSQKQLSLKNYTLDLAVLYNDLYRICEKQEYKSKYEYYSSLKSAKNIII